jgi:hypothetical protein
MGKLGIQERVGITMEVGTYRRVSLFWHLNNLVSYTLVVPE